MIQEQYVSFETAKLLKEKGFNEDINLWYTENGEKFFQYKYEIKSDWRVRQNQNVYLCPTHQMAMGWLREIHKLHITVFSSSQESWMYRITKPHQHLEDGVYGEDFYSYEDAIEAAIKYSLENLI